MGLFTKDKKPALMLAEDKLAYEPVNYNSVLDWLCGLDTTDYYKMLKVASIYRKAHQDAADALEETNQPTTFINEPITNQEAKNILDEDDLESSFLDEPDFLEEKLATSRQTILAENKSIRKAK